MVLRAVYIPEPSVVFGRDAYQFIVAKPRPDPLPVMVQRPSKEGRYWDDPVTSLRALPGLSLHFIDYFDWDELGCLDFQFAWVKIAACSEHQHLVGRHALVDVHYIQMEFVVSDPK
jgi:hypothetical protein